MVLSAVANLLIATSSLAAATSSSPATMPKLEKDELRIGFIKLTDMVPLAVAYEKGFFEDQGLYVTLEPQANWKAILDRVITGELDGAQMLAGQPLAATIGYGTKANVITALSLDRHGNAITVSNQVWQKMKAAIPADAAGRPEHPIRADALRPVVEKMRADGEAFRMGRETSANAPRAG